MSDGIAKMRVGEPAKEQFLCALEGALKSVDSNDIEDLYVYVKGRDAIAVSYSGAFEPFLGRKFGYNPAELRIDLGDDVAVLKLVAAALEATGKPGGRVFLRSSGAYCDVDHEEVSLVAWQWPGDDLVEEVVGVLETSKEASP